MVMKKNNSDTDFISGILIGLILGAMIGYFIFKFVHVVQNTPIKEAQVEHLEKKIGDWSKHPNKDKRNYFEVMYNNSNK
jgi:hypothetical protein